jgi:hypothetical protein
MMQETNAHDKNWDMVQLSMPTSEFQEKGRRDEWGKVRQNGAQRSTQVSSKAAQDSQVEGHPGGRRWGSLPYLQAGKEGQIEIRDSLPDPPTLFS